MKKLMSIMLVAAVTLSFASCGEKAQCDFCNEEYPVKKMRENNALGETIYICEECYEEMMEWFE